MNRFDGARARDVGVAIACRVAAVLGVVHRLVEQAEHFSHVVFHEGNQFRLFCERAFFALVGQMTLDSARQVGFASAGLRLTISTVNLVIVELFAEVKCFAKCRFLDII